MKFSYLGIFFLIFIINLLGFLAHYSSVGQAVYGDGRIYYSYSLSLFYDHDLDILNQMKHDWDPVNNNLMTPTGTRQNNNQALSYQSIGAGILLSPAIFIAHTFTRIINFLFPVSLPTHGYSDLYQITVGIFAICFVTLGLYLNFLSLLAFFKPRSVLLGLLCLWLTTNLFFYASLDPINTFPISFFLNSFFIYFLVQKKPHLNLISWLQLGLLSGIVSSVRENDLANLTLIFTFFIVTTHQKISFNKILVFIGGFVFALLPSLYVWNFFSGNLLSPRLSAHSWHISLSSISDLLFGTKWGLIFYSPSIIIISLCTLFLFPSLASLALLVFCCQFFIAAAFFNGDQGGSYGIRTTVSALPALSFAYTTVFDRLDRKVNLNTTILIISLLTLINFASIFYFLLISP